MNEYVGNRKKWDDYAIDIKKLTTVGKSDLLQWACKFPWPLSNRDYVFWRSERKPDDDTVIILMKGTALASTITLLELMGEAQLISSRTYKPIQVFAIAGVVYYALTLVISWIFRWLEARYNRYQRLAR